MSDADGDAVVAESLAGAVRRVGLGLGSEPRRVRAIIVDDLSGQGRTRRAEVDAVVMAAEELVPERLLSAELDDDAAVAALKARGLATEYAAFAVTVWRYALGLLGPEAVAPTLQTTLLAGGEAAEDAIDLQGTDRSEGHEGAGGRGGSRRFVVGGALCAAAVSMAALLLMSGSGDSDNSASASSTTAAPAAGGTSSRSGASTTVAPAASTTTAVRITTTTAASVSTPLVARDDTIGPYVPRTSDNGATWFTAQLEVTANDSGVYNRAEIVRITSHAYLTWNEAGAHFDYQPRYNGSFTDTFQYRLVHNATGTRSNVATVTVSVQCNTTLSCRP